MSGAGALESGRATSNRHCFTRGRRTCGVYGLRLSFNLQPSGRLVMMAELWEGADSGLQRRPIGVTEDITPLADGPVGVVRTMSAVRRFEEFTGGGAIPRMPEP